MVTLGTRPAAAQRDHGVLGAASDFNEGLAKKLKLSRTDMRCLDLIGRLGPMAAGRLAEESGLTTGSSPSSSIGWRAPAW